MRAFYGYRAKPPERYMTERFANPPDEPQFHGVEFDDGHVAVRWLTHIHSTSFWNSFAEFEHVHGHSDYDTEFVWYEVVPA